MKEQSEATCCSSGPPENPASTEKAGFTYRPIIAIFSVTFLMAVSIGWSGGLIHILELFIAISMCVLGIQKLQDLSGFAKSFSNYDLLAAKVKPYAYLYPFVEAGAGILMLSHTLTWLAAPAVLIVSTIGAISVFKAVYIQKRDLNCACVGGGSKVPLGFISLTENLMMIAMSIWMLVKM
ncbi:MAG: DoxX family protein [Luteolibacter sp.]